MRSIALLVLVLLLAGCMGGVFRVPPGCPIPELLVVPDPRIAEPSGGRPGDLPVHASRSNAWLVMARTNFSEPHRLTIESTDFAHFKPSGNDSEGGLKVGLLQRSSGPPLNPPRVTAESSPDWPSRACAGGGIRQQGFSLQSPEGGRPVTRGAGALVYTVGFWGNGTLFYTNLDEAHAYEDWPRAGWYNYTSGQPLKVYVYNQTRDEMPKRYKDAGYTGTIEGFNEALKSMRENSPILVYVAPEQAYTKPQYAGNATTPRHRLYGDALYFYIEVAHATAVPCPLVTGPACEAPPLPPA